MFSDNTTCNSLKGTALNALFFVALFVLTGTSPAWAVDEGEPINAVLGDASWVERYGDAPDLGVSEVRRIRTHLFYVIERLESVDTSHLSASQARRRASTLSGLREYAEAGVFPRREPNDGYDGRRPRFIDDRGVHCAVGEMIRRSRRPDLAKTIGKRWEYAYVPEIVFPELMSWADRHGFELTELAQIQPTYIPGPSPENIAKLIEQAKDRMTYFCAREHPLPNFVKLDIRVGKDTVLNASLAGAISPFSRCFRDQVVARFSRHWSVFLGLLKPVEKRLTIEITPPQEILERRLEQATLGGYKSRCVPRPGPIPQTATVRVMTSTEGTLFELVTTPRNEEVEACLARFSEFVSWVPRGGGAWGIDLEVNKPVLPRMQEDRLELYGLSAAYECREEATEKSYRVRVEALPETQRFGASVVGEHSKFESCFARVYEASARFGQGVTRRLPDGIWERYFRIDAPVKATFELTFTFDHKFWKCPEGGTVVTFGSRDLKSCDPKPDPTRSSLDR